MAITKSAKKAIKQNKARRIHNVAYINNIKKLIKETRAFVLEKNIKEAKALLPKAFAALDKAAKVGIIKKNNASRRKSRLANMIDKVEKSM